MPSAGKRFSIIYDSHGRGRVAPEGNFVFVKPDSSGKRKEFLPLGFTVVWAAPHGVLKDSTDWVSMPEDPFDPHAS